MSDQLTDDAANAATTNQNQPAVYYACEYCFEIGNDQNCAPHDQIRLAPCGQWMCEHCYTEAEHEYPDDSQPWSDLPKAIDLKAENTRLRAEIAARREGRDYEC